MGLLDCNGDVNADAVNFLAHLCAGLFFDALCDSYVEMQTVSRICQAFCKSENVEAQRVVLMICSEYDAMNHPVPEAIWWISGSKLLVPPFIEGFLSYLREYLKELEEQLKSTVRPEWNLRFTLSLMLWTGNSRLSSCGKSFD